MKVLVIGLGSIAQKHINALKELYPEVSITALRSSKQGEKIEGVSDIYNIPELSFVPTFIIVSNPTNLHLESIKMALQFKCPIFIEKPILHTLSGLEQLGAVIKKENVLTYIACNLRFLSSMQFLYTYLSDHPTESINEVNAYGGAYLPEWRNGKDSYSFYAEKGGGVQLDLIHEFDYLYWIFGKPIDIKAYRRSGSSLAISSIDYANYLLIYDKFVANVILNYYRRDAKRTFELVFSDKTWMVDIFQNRITQADTIIFEDSTRVIDTYKTQMQYFVNCINKNRVEMNSFSEAFEVLKICLHDKS
jgi:predicted dehydrogenase